MKCAADDVRRAVILITAAFILHNFLIDEKDQSVVELAQMIMRPDQQLTYELKFCS